jgi:hypothetical protein
MAEDAFAWLVANKNYNGVPEALRNVVQNEKLDLYVVTTRHARQVHTFVNSMAGTFFPMERIFSQADTGVSKAEALAALAAKAPPSVERMTFIDDELATLQQVAATPGLEKWELYMGACAP